MSFIEAVPVRARYHDADYESYVPPGILRASWIGKHERRVPAVAVLVFKLEDAKAVDWPKLEVQVNTHTRRLRDVLKGHLGDIHVLLLQSAAIPLVEEAMEVREQLGEKLMR